MSEGAISSFFGFLREKKGALLAAVLLLVGALLLLSGRGEQSSATDSDDEERLSAFCSSIEGVGECKVYITHATESRASVGRVESVAIVCRGADSVEVRSELTHLIASLYGIGANRIFISKMA